jgi:Cupin domain
MVMSPSKRTKERTAKSSRTASRLARKRRSSSTSIRAKRSSISSRGPLEYHVDGQTPTTLEAGDVLLVPADTVHGVRNVGSGNAAELATYVVEKGKPFLVVVE